MTFLEQIQINKANKIAGLHPGTKLWILTEYTICAVVLGTVKVTALELKLLYVPWFFVILALAAASGALKKFIKVLKSVGFVAAVIFVAQL